MRKGEAKLPTAEAATAAPAAVQGDQIGRIFAFWAIVFFGVLYEKYKCSPNFCATFFSSVKVQY
jgi:hypothetical protein